MLFKLLKIENVNPITVKNMGQKKSDETAKDLCYENFGSVKVVGGP